MTRTPWTLWDVSTGEPSEGADTLEALAVIERSIAMHDAAGTPQHPAILHLHIHATEMSNSPERAMRSADILGTLCPDAGHINHMPGHTYVLCGEYEKAKIAMHHRLPSRKCQQVVQSAPTSGFFWLSPRSTQDPFGDTLRGNCPYCQQRGSLGSFHP